MIKFFIKTHGCKANQLESDIIKEKLLNEDYQETKKADSADIYILNSCSVTETADIEALRTLRNIKHKKPEIITVLTGCSAQLNHNDLKNNGIVDIILGNNDKFDIVDALKKHQSCVKDIFSIREFNNHFVRNYSKTRAYLKIQDGCNNYCSYCTIPYARGKSRSNSIKNIIEQIKIYTDAGIKEIVLTGIHIGQWGEDFSTPKELFTLLESIENTNIQRYRLGSLNTLEIKDQLLDFLAESDKFCPHFHLSLQSLTDKTLTAMNRLYSAHSCLVLIDKINDKFKLPFLGSDIIAGFPGETDEDFHITLENVKKSGLSNIHVFPYSIRKNTNAAAMQNQLSEKDKQNRANILREAAHEKLMSFLNKNLNTYSQVLIEKRPDKNTGLLKGVTKNYLEVILDSDNINLCNTIQNIKITEYTDKSGVLKGIVL